MYIYLDQNKWIDLARAYHDKPDGENYKSVLELLSNLVNGKKLILPISAIHYVETTVRKSDDSRIKLGEVMSKLSQGNCMIPNTSILMLEIYNSVNNILKQPIFNLNHIVFGNGLDHALGCKAEVNINNDSVPKDILDEFNKKIKDPNTFYELIIKWNREFGNFFDEDEKDALEIQEYRDKFEKIPEKDKKQR